MAYTYKTKRHPWQMIVASCCALLLLLVILAITPHTRDIEPTQKDIIVRPVDRLDTKQQLVDESFKKNIQPIQRNINFEKSGETPNTTQTPHFVKLALPKSTELPGLSIEPISYQNPTPEALTFAKLNIFKMSEVDQSPIPIRTISPIYPWELKRQKLSGQVMLKFSVDVDGSVSQIHVESSSHPQFADAAKAAVQKWQFKPAQRNGHNVACWVRLPMPFNM